MNPPYQPFDNLRVTCTGLGVAPLVSARMLCEQGAHVAVVAAPEVLRARKAALTDFCAGFSFAEVNPSAPEGRSALQQLRTASDVWIEETGVCETGALFSAARPQASPQAGPVCCTFSAFPEGGTSLPLCVLESTVSTRACLYEPLTGIGRRRPYLFPAASLTAGMYGAVAIGYALATDDRREITVSLFDSALSLHALRFLLLSEAKSRWDALRWLSSPFMSLWQAGDNRWIYLHVGLTKHMALLLRSLEANGFTTEAQALRKLLTPGAIKDPVSLDSPAQARKITRLLTTLFLKRTASEWEILLRRHKLCCVKVRDEAEWQAFTRGPEFLKETVQPSACIRLAPAPIPERGAGGTPRPGFPIPKDFTNIPVFDFTQVIAGPLAGRTLAELGAPVTRIRNPHFDQAFTEPFAAMFNSGKENFTLELSKPQDRQTLDELTVTRKPQVIFQHVDMAGADPSCVFVQILAYPEHSAWASGFGFEQNIQAMAGLMAAYGRKGRPELFPVAIYDTTTGLLAAFGACVGLYARARFGTGIRAKCSLMDSAVLLSHCTHIEASYRRDAPVKGGEGFGFLGLKCILKRELKRPGSPVQSLDVPGLGGVYIPASPVRFGGIAMPLKATPLPDTEIPRPKPTMISRLKWVVYFLMKG